MAKKLYRENWRVLWKKETYKLPPINSRMRIKTCNNPN
jgi:hypothetical protein